MEYEPMIDFLNMPSSEFLAKAASKRIGKLRTIVPDMIHCSVLFEAPHRQHAQGNLYVVRLAVKMPRGLILVNRGHGDKPQHEDAYVALRDAFIAARRKLRRYKQQLKGRVKVHGLDHLKLGQRVEMAEEEARAELNSHNHHAEGEHFEQTT